MFVVFARIGRLGAFVPDDAKLLRRQHGLPLVVALLDRVVRHVGRLCGGGIAEQGAEEGGDGGHGPEGAVVGDGDDGLG